MAKKHYTTYKGKTGLKVLVTGLSATAISLAIVGGTIVSRLDSRPDIDKDYKDYIEETTPDHVLEPSVDVTTESYDTDVILPELKEPLPELPPKQEVEELGVEFVDVLAKLTNLSKNYIQTSTGSTSSPNLQICGLTNINISNNGEVSILGQVSINDKFNNFIANIKNTDTSLAIYNLPTDKVTEQQFIGALDELLSSENTQFAIQLKQHFTLNNEQQIVANILQTRLNELAITDPTADEVTYVVNALQNPSKVKFSVLLNNRQTSKNGYIYSFSVIANIGKYTYSFDHSFESNKILNVSALKINIENALSDISNCTISPALSSNVNQALYIVDSTANNLQTENTLSNNQ